MSLTIGIALGDVTGIGPEVTIKALGQMPADDDCRYVLLGARGEVLRLVRAARRGSRRA